VEGDIGMRVSVGSLVDTATDFLTAAALDTGVTHQALERHVAQIRCDHAFLPDTPQTLACDRLLAAACLRTAFARHAGRFTEVYLPDGKRIAQTGKDLRAYERVVLTGGFAAAHGDHNLLAGALSPVPADTDGPALVPRDPEVLLDTEYLVPLVASLASGQPAVAADLMRAHLSTTATMDRQGRTR
ncbi:MAG: hypothetical protein GF331_13060, partial [Chitinivibrionales bacterium]|nr:hypothetical protein [Chitinivibrionales bacterium]